MNYAKVTGIIRASVLDKIEKRLIRESSPGLSVTEVKGWGELKDFFTHDWLVSHARIEISVLAVDAERDVVPLENSVEGHIVNGKCRDRFF